MMLPCDETAYGCASFEVPNEIDLKLNLSVHEGEKHGMFLVTKRMIDLNCPMLLGIKRDCCLETELHTPMDEKEMLH